MKKIISLLLVFSLFAQPVLANNFYYNGQQLDDETELYFYGGRYYNPQIGRFLTPDHVAQNPIRPQSLNRYSYVENNPVNRIDPDGHFWFFAALLFIAKAAVVGAVTGAIAGGISGGIGASSSGGNVLAGIAHGAGIGAVNGAVFGATAGAGTVGLALVAPQMVGTVASLLVINSAAGAVSGGVTSSMNGGTFSSGAKIGGISAFLSVGVSQTQLGLATGNWINSSPVGKMMIEVNRWVGGSFNSFIQQYYGGQAIGQIPSTFLTAKEVWHFTDSKGAAGIGRSGGFRAGTLFFNPDEIVDGVALRNQSLAQIYKTLDISPNKNVLFSVPRSSIALTDTTGKAFTWGNPPASEAGLYGPKNSIVPIKNVKISVDITSVQPTGN